MTRTASALLLVAALASTAPAAAAAPAETPDAFRRFALAIGSSHGGAGRDTLLYAESDARTFGALLAEMGGVATGDARVLSGPGPGELERAFRDLRGRVASARAGRGRTEVVLYYSGHADERGLLLEGHPFPYDRLRGLIDSIPADVRIAVLDACASGAITRLKGGRRRPAFAVDASSSMRGYAFLTSSSPDEASQESDQIRGSFFTHSLVTGLRGAADVSGDGKVTLSEAYHFAFHETLARTERTKGGPQHPAYDMKLSGTGDVVVTDMRQTSAGLVLAKDLEGRLFVRERDGRLVAELYKPAGRGMELGLAPGAYSVRLEQRKALSASTLELAEGRRTTLSAGDFEPVHRERTTLRGGSAKDTSAGEAAAEGPAAGFEVRDQIDLRAGPDPRHTLSLGLLFNRQKDPFHGLQLTLFFNQAASSVHGGQASVFGNLAQGPLRGGQASAIGNVALDTVRGAQAAPLFNVNPEPTVGFQGTGILNVSGGVEGGQAAGVANLSDRKVKGGQGAGVLNLARGLEGGQGAGVANFNIGPGRGGQGAGVVNVTGGMTGGMGAGVANLSYGPVKGGQGAAVLNVARGIEGAQGAAVANLSLGRAEGAQVSAVLNAAGDVKGAQVTAVLNVARDVEGFQVGLVNISRDIRGGAPLGLLNYSQTGLHSLNLWTDEMGYQHSTLLSGSRHFYTFVSLGKKLASDRTLNALGYGLGGQRAFGSWFGAADLGASILLEDWEFNTSSDHDAPELYRLRLQGGREVLPNVSVFGGLSLNWLWNHSGREGREPWGGYQVEPFADQAAWPGLFLGLRLGR